MSPASWVIARVLFAVAMGLLALIWALSAIASTDSWLTIVGYSLMSTGAFALALVTLGGLHDEEPHA